MATGEYLTWVRGEAAVAPVTYLPHRREPASQLTAVASIPGVVVSQRALPAELLLAGATEPLEILTLPSSTTTTLPLLLAGTGSVVRRRRSDAAAEESGASR